MKYVLSGLMAVVLCLGTMGCGKKDTTASEKSAKDIADLQQSVTSLQSEVADLKSLLNISQNDICALKIKAENSRQAVVAKNKSDSPPTAKKSGVSSKSKNKAPAKSGASAGLTSTKKTSTAPNGRHE